MFLVSVAGLLESVLARSSLSEKARKPTEYFQMSLANRVFDDFLWDEILEYMLKKGGIEACQTSVDGVFPVFLHKTGSRVGVHSTANEQVAYAPAREVTNDS